MTDLLTNQYFTLLILAILLIVLYMYYNYKCPVTVEGLSNIDLSHTAQDITQYPFENTRYAPYGQVNGSFDNNVSQKLAERGYDPRYLLPSISDRYVNEFKRGDSCMPDMIANNGYSGQRRSRGPQGSRRGNMSIYDDNSIEAMTSEDDSDYVCYKTTDGKTFASMGGSAMTPMPSVPAVPTSGASGSNPGLYNGNNMTWDDIENYIKQKTEYAKQALMTNPQVQQAKANALANPQVQQARAKLASNNGCSIM